MPLSRGVKGKKRAYIESSSESEDNEGSSGSVTPVASSSRIIIPPLKDALPKVKKPKRAVTRQCPICDEDIPIRLLGAHLDLETGRVNEIIQSIGSTEVLGEAEPDDGITARARRSALKAKKSITRGAPTPRAKLKSSAQEATTEIVDSTLRLLKRHRKQRHVKLREMTREDDEADGRWALNQGSGTACPVCLKLIPGDADVVEAHVDACLAHEARLQEEREREERERDRLEMEQDVDIDGDVRIRVTDGVNFQGTGFDVRNANQEDVDEDIDVDGDDDVLFGAQQFTEGDILATVSTEVTATPSPPGNPGVQVDIDVDDNITDLTEKSLRDLVAEGKVIKRPLGEASTSTQEVKKAMEEVMGLAEAEEVDALVELAKKASNPTALIKALEDKVKLLESTRISSSTSLLCRICIDPYTEPTVSTGCWHTCCRECWLRCLASTKLCPICKRITAASDLRRVYL
ncbi:hypothetical protein QCA50_000432 [Cerrena zonata]|uniref:RING-type domain-containing protein n=1 Tax=Cerrena zonata TaxID=2478898 RepID=A0AAW0GWQ1_9APHY